MCVYQWRWFSHWSRIVVSHHKYYIFHLENSVKLFEIETYFTIKSNGITPIDKDGCEMVQKKKRKNKICYQNGQITNGKWKLSSSYLYLSVIRVSCKLYFIFYWFDVHIAWHVQIEHGFMFCAKKKHIPFIGMMMMMMKMETEDKGHKKCLLFRPFSWIMEEILWFIMQI